MQGEKVFYPTAYVNTLQVTSPGEKAKSPDPTTNSTTISRQRAADHAISREWATHKQYRSATLQWEEHRPNNFTFDPRKELRRQSSYRRFAISRGVIRPFLLLASMHPVKRRVVAKTLGLSTTGFTDDAHQEAWHMLTDSRKGIIRQATSPLFDKLRKSKSGKVYYVDWTVVVERVTRNAFSDYNRIWNRRNKDIPKTTRQKINKNIKSAKSAQTINPDKTIEQLEEILLAAMFEAVKKSLIIENGEMVDGVTRHSVEERAAVLQHLRNEGHFGNESFLQFFVEALLVEPTDDPVILDALKKFAKTREDSYKADIASLCISGFLMLNPIGLPVAGPVFFVKAFRLARKIKPGDLLPVITCLSMQRAVLACDGIDINNYYNDRSSTI
eukprot:CFRG2945T1